MSWYYQISEIYPLGPPVVLRGKNPYIDPTTPYISNGKGGVIAVESSVLNQGDVFGNGTIHYGTEQNVQTITISKIGMYAVPKHLNGNKIVALISMKMPEHYRTNLVVKYYPYV